MQARPRSKWGRGAFPFLMAIVAACASSHTSASSRPPRGVIVTTLHPRHLSRLPGFLSSIDANLNCLPLCNSGPCRYPIIIMYNLNNPDPEDPRGEGWTPRQLAELKAIADSKFSACETAVTLLRVDTHFTIPDNVDIDSMRNHIRHVLPMPASYRSMCRFWSGPFFLLPELDDFDWYMRL